MARTGIDAGARRLTIAMCVGQVANLLPHVVVPAVMAQHLIPLWKLSASEAGLMASSYAVGYMIAVPILTMLTDRLDARLILIAGSLVSAIATFAFGLFADGLISASLLWGLAGLGFAGAYMPGLRALTDRLTPGDSSRAITLFTGSFSLGVGLSFLVAQVVAERWGWRAAFFVTAAAPLLMVAIAVALERKPPPAGGRALTNPLPVLRNRPAMGYILGYGVHCFELYGMRTWLVAFWGFVASRSESGGIISAVALSVIVSLIAMPASIIGNEAAIRFGRRRTIAVSQIASAATGLAIGVLAGAEAGILLALMILYAVLIPMDSGALTAGMSMTADPAQRGATLAMHSMVGFGLSAVGAWLFGVALDSAGGPAEPRAWLAGFALLSAAILLGPLCLLWASRSPPPDHAR